MSRIEIERKPQRSIWPWLVALLLVAIAAWGIWSYFGADSAGIADPDPAVQTAPPPAERMDTAADLAPSGGLPRDTLP